jgi:hypothetical protein
MDKILITGSSGFIGTNLVEFLLTNNLYNILGFDIKIPFFIFRCATYIVDVLKLMGVNFPMTSFTLKNMTTDNLHDLDLIRELAPKLPVSREDGVKKTVIWISSILK